MLFLLAMDMIFALHSFMFETLTKNKLFCIWCVWKIIISFFAYLHIIQIKCKYCTIF